MKTKQRLPLVLALMLGFVLPASAAGPPAPKVEKAGAITALLPIAHIERGAGKTRTVSDAKKGDEVVWNDNIKTERGGRARITLNDQSILSLGSQAELRIVKHDARNQQTALQMTYGRVRAEVAKVTRQGGSFELRTPTAVAGVIGTDFGIDSSPASGTTFLCISGLVQVSNSDPNVAGSVQCAPGLTTTVTAGNPPTPPQNATPEQIQQLLLDTEPAIITAMLPLSALPGQTLDATMSGTKLAGVKGVNISGSGVAVSLQGAPTDTAVTVHLVIAANAEPGPRAIHLTKQSGADSAAIFTILAPPTAQGADLKKPFIDLIGVQGQTTENGLNAYLVALQQTADQAIQQLQQANGAKLNLNDATNAFNSQVTVVQNAINTAKSQIQEAVKLAGGTFQTQYDQAYQALLQRHPDGAPDEQFNQAVKAIFDAINGSLGNTFTAIRSNLNSAMSAANTNIQATQQTWMQQVLAASNPPVPTVNATERSIDLGAAFGSGGVAALDAGNTKVSGGASIVSYKWVLCDPSYKPAQFGVPLAGNATAGCNPLSGYQSSSSDFSFTTCNLSANDYIARFTATDSNNQSAAMDVKVHVLPPTYDDPATRVRNLAQAYMTLQPNNFLSFFDETGFSGFTALSENVRNTFPSLASMQINPRVSQAAITCNDATVRADWVQNYTYKQNPNIAFNQTEQLSMRMVRQPGKGWFIVDFQGDNGTVQGQLPGPAVTDNPQPDLVTLAVFPTYAGGTSTNPPVPPGDQSFTAVVQNIGGADFSVSTVVRFQLLDGSNNPISSPVDVPLQAPLAAGATVNVQATLTVPNTISVGTPFQILANVNPTCLPEAHCDPANQATEALILGTPIKLTQVTTPTLQVGGAAAALTVNVSAAASVTLTLPTGITTTSPLTQTVSGAGNVTWNVQAGFTAVSGSNLTMTVTASGAFPVTLNAAYTVTAPVFTQSVIPTLLAGGAAQPLTVSVSVPGTYTLVLPSGITTTSPNPQTLTPATGLTLIWNIQANFTAATGSGLFANITNGIYSFAAKYNNTGQPNYVITSVTFGNHTAPYTGANAMQVNETTTLVAVIQNIGNGSPTGSIVATGTCVPLNPNDTTSCVGGGNPTTTVAAPSAGQSVTATMPVDFNGMLPGRFNGTVTLTTAIAQSTADDSATVPFDVADFVVTVLNPLAPQNILPGSTQNVTVQVTAVGTAAFAIPLVPSGAYTGISYSPPTVNVTNGTQVFTVTAAAGTAPGAFGAIFTGTNHGVTRQGVEAFAVIAPTIVSTNLFLNDASNPLQIQMGSTTPATVNLKLSGAAFSGSATLVPPTSVVGFTTSINPSLSVLANGTFDLTVSATTSATTVVTPLVITAQLPNTSPVLSITYTLYVKAIGLPDLQVASVTPPASFANAAWLDGQGADFAVTIQNNGNTTTAGGELVRLDVNGLPAGSTTLASTLAPGASTQVTVHAVAPDAHGNAAFSGNGTVKVKVDPDRVGDLNYTNNSLSTSVPLANWHFAVSGAGSSPNSTLFVHTDRLPPYTDPVTFVGTVDGGSISSYSQSLFNPVPGQTSTYITIGNFAAAGAGTFTGDVTLTNAIAQSGPYFAQVIVQILDGATVTAQRQATVYIDVSATFPNATAVPSLTSSANNCTGTGCTSSGTALQINGGLAEQFSITLSMMCTPLTGGSAVPCPGTADLAIQDAPNTNTTALGSTKGVVTGTPLALRVGAVYDPNGNVQTGPASGYLIGINGVQQSAAAREGAAISPDPVGTPVQFLFNVGDLNISANTGPNSCTGVIANGAPLSLSVSWQAIGGFNTPSLSWQWEDGNHSPVGATPLSFSSPSGTATFSGGSYSPSPTFTLTNTQARDGLASYFLAVTISNGTSTATKYFPFYFDLSLSQSFCGAAGSARGYSTVQGSWSRTSAGLGGPLAGAAQIAGSMAGGADVRILASDISYMPSMPKFGDTVQVRFRARNAGDVDAVGVPIALQINGATVARDTFDVPAGRTILGGLSWTADEGTNRPARAGRDADPSASPAGMVAVQAALVVDPQHVTRQRTTQEKSAPIARFNLRTSSPTSGGATASNSQRILIELEDGACVGLRLTSGGTMPCGTADLEITIGDLGKSQLQFEAMAGVGDAGTSFETSRRGRSSVRYGAQAAAMSGHTYQVQLANGSTATVNVESVRNPAELDAKARALFRASAARILRSLGGSSAPQDPGDLTGGGSHPTVFIVLNVQGM